MQKDVLYIDAEDDITAIIGKIKSSESSVVALVPPKRIGVLQSIVNLQLISRSAKKNHKKIALVTVNPALMALAAAAKIPVAKNLQSKPEIIKSQTDDSIQDDIIEGATVSIGDHAGQQAVDNSKVDKAIDELSDEVSNQKDKKSDSRSASKPKIPDFNKFRKKLVLIIIAGVLLVGFIIWAIFFAPRATVVISAKTTNTSINTPIVIKAGATTDFKKAIIKATKLTDSEEKSITFSPTGKKDAGEKATGSVILSAQSTSGVTVPAGTRLTTSGGLVFITDSAALIPASTISAPDCFPTACEGTASVSVSAAENGSKYNAASGALTGAPSGVSAQLDNLTSGGVTRMVSIVTAGDVQAAKKKLADEDSASVRDELVAKFDKSTKVATESFVIGYENVESSPSIGKEANTAKLTATVTYTIYGVDQAELDSFIGEYLKTEINKDENRQRIYDSGANEASFQEVKKASNGATATLIATAKIGPDIKDSYIKEQTRGKRYGEIQDIFSGVQGVEKVDVKFFPFWVNTVPDNDAKITVEFTVDESS